MERDDELQRKRDEAQRPVTEAGGGEAEGFEEAEELLEENATHGEGGADPEADAFTGELESDESGAEYGEADEARPSDA
jgi:hypothetical protein